MSHKVAIFTELQLKKRKKTVTVFFSFNARNQKSKKQHLQWLSYRNTTSDVQSEICEVKLSIWHISHSGCSKVSARNDTFNKNRNEWTTDRLLAILIPNTTMYFESTATENIVAITTTCGRSNLKVCWNRAVRCSKHLQYKSLKWCCI